MAKPKGINQKARWRAHSIRIARYADRVQSVYDTLNKEIASTVVKTSYDGTEPFHFSDYPLTKKKFEEVQASFVRDLRSVIYSGTSEEWKQSNLVQDLLADKVLKFYGAKERGKKHRVYYQTNSDALKAFQQRKEDGMGLSERLWNQSKNYKEEMEYAISSAIEKGTSAVKLSKRLSKYLVDFPSLKHDYKDKFGKAVTCQDCEYRSVRLARSEINMAYRKAEQERWKQFDFVLGYEVKLTQNGRHVPDICDDLAGKYPKDFVFTGWHPNCMCYVIPILKTEEQFWNYEDAEPVTEPPKGFNDWLRENAERIDKAAENGTLPYWYTDNERYVKNANANKAPLKKDSDIIVNVVKGDVKDIDGGKAFLDEIQELANEYGIPVDIEVKPHRSGEYAKYTRNKDGKKIIVLNRSLERQKPYYKDAPYAYQVAGLEEKVDLRMRAVGIHEYAHLLTEDYKCIPSQRYTWEWWKQDARKRGIKVKEARTQYEKYIERVELKLSQHDKQYVDMLKQLGEVQQEYDNEKRSSYKISGYAKNHSNGEFIAEAFAHVKMYGKGNIYADKVVEIIDNYYKRRKK